MWGTALACLGAFVGAAGAAPSATLTTVVSGLDNPRDLAFGPNGKLYVAEAGSGGPDCVAGTCAGFTSGISLVNVTSGTARRIVSGLASTSDPGGFGAIGVDGISFLGNGTLYGILGEASDAVPSGLPAGVTAGLEAELGRLVKANPSGDWKVVSDVGHADFLWSEDHQFLVPPGQFPDANPYAVLAGGGVEWVVDAATNTIDRVDRNGSIASRTFIPNPPLSDAVPTCIDKGPDGALYIGELTGVPNGAGAASIWRFNPATGDLSQWATGLTAVTGCGFGVDGNFYAVEFSTTGGFFTAGPGDGAVVRVPAHSTSPTVVASGLSFPGGFAAGADGSLYVSNWSTAPASTGLGSVLRITLG